MKTFSTYSKGLPSVFCREVRCVSLHPQLDTRSYGGRVKSDTPLYATIPPRKRVSSHFSRLRRFSFSYLLRRSWKLSSTAVGTSTTFLEPGTQKQIITSLTVPDL
jgi:hypothetical protein